MKNGLRSTKFMPRITRKELLDNFDEYLDRVDIEDIGFVITNDGKDELVLCPARWFNAILKDDYTKKDENNNVQKEDYSTILHSR